MESETIESLKYLVKFAVAHEDFGREVLIYTEESLNRKEEGVNGYMTLYLESLEDIDEFGISYKHEDGGKSFIPWTSIIRLHVRGQKVEDR